MFTTYEFILIAKDNPNIDKIKYLKLNEYSKNWQYNIINWREIFYY